MHRQHYVITVTDDGRRRDVEVDHVGRGTFDFAGTPIGATGDSTQTLPLAQLAREAAAMLTRDFEARAADQ